MTLVVLPTICNLLLAVSASDGPEVKQIDLRNASDAGGSYTVIFCARKSEGGGKPGHAFVVWAEENDKRQFSAAQAYGFYPDDKEKTKGIFGPVKGRVVNEALEPASSKTELLTHRLIVKVNKDVYLKSQERIKDFKTTQHDLYHKNCIGLVHEVAVTIGIIARKPKSLEFPWDYAAELAEKADVSKPK